MPPLLHPVRVVAGKYRGRRGHVLKRFVHRPTGRPYVDVQIKGDVARDQLPRELSGFLVVPDFWFVVTVREERTAPG